MNYHFMNTEPPFNEDYLKKMEDSNRRKKLCI